jgi:hypothetical protein
MRSRAANSRSERTTHKTSTQARTRVRRRHNICADGRVGAERDSDVWCGTAAGRTVCVEIQHVQTVRESLVTRNGPSWF